MLRTRRFRAAFDTWLAAEAIRTFWVAPAPDVVVIARIGPENAGFKW